MHITSYEFPPNINLSESLESNEFGIGKMKTKYIDCNFSKFMRRSKVHNNGVIEEDFCSCNYNRIV